MIIYNKIWLNNLHVHEQADRAHQAGDISNSELTLIKERYPVGFYHPGLLASVGLFTLTFIIVLFSAGLLTLVFSELHVYDSFGWLLFLGVVTYTVLEVTVKKKHYYQAGVDQALLWLSGCLLSSAFLWMMSTINFNNHYDQYLCFSMIILLLSSYFTLRFADVLMSIILPLSFLSAVFLSWQHLGVVGNATLPFLIIILFGTAYYILSRIVINAKAKFYQSCVTAIRFVCLVSMYFAGNYYVIDHLNELLNGASATSAHPLHMSSFFWVWTLLLPFAFLVLGVRRKEVVLLRTGLLLIACAAYTCKYYFHFMPLEIALTMAGVVVLIMVYILVRYLKTPKYGFTTTDLNQAHLLNRIHAEALITGDLAHRLPAAPVKSISRFGGGSFGGGGSSSDF